MNSYYLFFIHPDLKDLLLEELRRKHSVLQLSFSNKDFLSMKGPEGYAKKLQKNPLVFAKRMAVFLEKSAIPSNFSIEVSANEFWNYKLIESCCDTYELKKVEKPEQAPARAWHKIQEVCELFNWSIQPGESFIEIGSAPGGISYFLLDKGVKLTAIDPAAMDASLSGFKHIRESIFDVKKNQLPKKCDWLISDLNLKCDINISQCRRIADYYPSLKGGFITIKTPKAFDVKHMQKWREVFNDFETFIFHLPSHRREMGLFFTKKKRK